jgi:hypothetical protein
VKEQVAFSEAPKIPALSMFFFLVESFDRLHTIISWAGYELYVAVTCRCGEGRGMIDPPVLSVTAV